MGFWDGILNIFVPCGNEYIRTYVEELRSEIESMDIEEGWMREDLLTSELYACTLKGECIGLRELLFGSGSINTRQNIIVIVGGRHIGKKCFAMKLLQSCQKSIESEARNLIKAKNVGSYRIPIVVSYEWYRNLEKGLELEEIIEKVIEKKCVSINSDEQRSYLRKGISELLKEGRFCIYFEGNDWLGAWGEDLERVLRHGEIVKDYNKKTRYKNLAVLTVYSEMELKQSFLYRENFTPIKLNRLTKKETEKYLEKHLPELYNIAQEENSIMEVLSYPEHLKMLKDLDKKSLLEISDRNELRDVYDFYEFFLRANIRKKLEGTEKANKNREDAILSTLGKYAVGLYLDGKKERRNPSQYFRFSDFIEAGILDKDGEFVFPLCGYYLAAKEIKVELEKGTLKEIPECLLEEPLDMILLWISEMIDEYEYFSWLFHLLEKNSSRKLLLLAKVAKRADKSFQEVFLQKIYEIAFSDLRKDFYDNSVLEAFEELEGNGVVYLKDKYTELSEFKEKEKNNIKKRIVYFLGISHNGIIREMLDELMEEETDLHLKYHIIRAIVENYGRDGKSTEWIDEKFDQIAGYCAASCDPIIKSDFCVLYNKCKQGEWMAPENIYSLANELKLKMEDNTYWVRAHAAGAIGRRNMQDAYDLLMQRIQAELQLIYNKREEGFRNSIKVISYSVESICEISDTREEEKKEIIFRLAALLDMDKLGDQDIEDAYSTIATGIEYMISAEPDKLPFNLGGRFRNHAIDYQKVLLHTFRALEYDMDSDMAEIEPVKEKREKLESIMENGKGENDKMKENKTVKRKIKILQLTDWHFKEKNADNNLILQEVEKIEYVDILVITGDLKHYNSDYSNTIAILRELVEKLGLSPKDVFMVPGNHDNGDFEDKEKILKEIRNNIYKDRECYKKYRDKLYCAFSSYEEFLREFYGEGLMEQGGIHNQLHIWHDCLYILCMNTALLCDDSTEKNKIVDIEELSEIHKCADIPVLCISHHKLGQLYLEHETAIQSVFKNLNVSALLSGDIHRSKIEDIPQGSRSIPNYICGMFLGDSSDRWPERNIVIYDIDLEKRTLTPNLFKWEKDKFVPGHTFDKEPEKIESGWEKMPIELQ